MTRDKDDWSDVVHIYHDFNDDNHLFLAKGWVVWAGNGEGGMKVRLGKPQEHPNGIVIPFEPIEGTWNEDAHASLVFSSDDDFDPKG